MSEASADHHSEQPESEESATESKASAEELEQSETSTV